MAKRFADTSKYKKAFIRSLPASYKILWDYICLDCDHAGIWYKDFQIAQLLIGEDAPVNEADALKYFNEGEERIVIVEAGKKWVILPFVSFQYGKLNEQNRVHASVLDLLLTSGINLLSLGPSKGLVSPLQGCKDKDKDKDKDKGGLLGGLSTDYPQVGNWVNKIKKNDTLEKVERWKKERGE